MPRTLKDVGVRERQARLACREQSQRPLDKDECGADHRKVTSHANIGDGGGVMKQVTTNNGAIRLASIDTSEGRRLNLRDVTAAI